MLNRLTRRHARQMAREIVETSGDFEAMTPADLRVIQLALETHERVHIERTRNPDAPAALAARKVRAKIDRNMTR